MPRGLPRAKRALRGWQALGRRLGAVREASCGLRPHAVLGDAWRRRRTGSTLFELAVSSIGAARRGELLRLRHALVVRTIAGKLTEAPRAFDRDSAGARELLALFARSQSRGGPLVRAELVEDLEALAAYREPWDALAVECARPYCSPAWLLPWWRHAAPTGARLRTVVVLDGEELVAIAPLYASRDAGLDQHRLLGRGASLGVEPLARGGRGAGVGPAHRAGSSSAMLGRPRSRGHQGGFAVAEADRADAWPGGARLRRELSLVAPALTLAGGSFEDWLASKSKHFRSQVRRDRRRLDEAGAVTLGLRRREEELADGTRGVRRAAPRPLGRARRIRRADGGRGADAPRGCPRARPPAGSASGRSRSTGR